MVGLKQWFFGSQSAKRSVMKGGYGKRMCAVVWLCLGLGFSGCDALYRLLDKEGAEEKALIGEIVPRESNEIVAQAQGLLYLYGYNPGKGDGILGLRTRNALEAFQKDNGLPPSRFIDKATWEQLNIFNDSGLVVDQKLNVEEVQRILQESGCNPGEPDGKMGEKTREAIKKFQKAHQLEVDGRIGYQTLKKLAEQRSEKSHKSGKR